MKNTRFCDGKTMRELSIESGIPLPTINNRWGRGLRTYEELTSDEGLHGAEFRMKCATLKGERLLRAIQKSGLNITDVSKRTGVSRQVIYNFCHNDSDISSNRLCAVCDAVCVSMDYIMKGGYRDDN